MFKKLIDRFVGKDHALAAIASTLIMASTFITEVLPQVDFLHLSPQTAAIIVLIGALCATVGGQLESMPALTWAGVVTLAYQVVTLLIAHHVGVGSKIEVALLTVAGLLKVLAKFTKPGTDPIGTGASTDMPRESTQTQA